MLIMWSSSSLRTGLCKVLWPLLLVHSGLRGQGAQSFREAPYSMFCLFSWTVRFFRSFLPDRCRYRFLCGELRQGPVGPDYQIIKRTHQPDEPHICGFFSAVNPFIRPVIPCNDCMPCKPLRIHDLGRYEYFTSTRFLSPPPFYNTIHPFCAFATTPSAVPLFSTPSALNSPNSTLLNLLFNIQFF